MFSPLALIALFVSSASAILITSPGTTKNWTNDGSQTITWTSVSTDPLNFTVVLTNINRSLMPSDNQILKALVLTSAGTTTVDPPSDGWPAVGGTYRVNFCKDSESLNTILVQSDNFNITAAPVQSSASVSGSKTGTTTPTVANTNTGAGAGAGTATGSAGASESATDSASAPAGTSGALPAMGVHTGFIGALVLLAAMLA
ncbi:hypothetical protein DFH09DRAFT_1129418 [Mycena vulgaris]|nr:hypothetical protein DFH09DRAFT_1129418 [Mycena vulgaris]